MRPGASLAAKYLYAVGGMYVMAFGYAMILQATLGLASWQVLHQALADLSGLSYGRITQLVGAAVLLISLLLGIRPTLTTVINMLLVGPMVDFSRAVLIPVPDPLAWRLVLLVGGNMVSGFGIAMYTSSGIGAGPRDSLMLGLRRLTGANVGTVRTVLELGVLAIGFALGGPIGLGTVVGPFVLGVSVAWSFELFRRLSALPRLAWLLKVPVPPAPAGLGLRVRRVLRDR
jgi:uncharacterized membrane protein YczE